ncbi:MAG: ThuA domain-containing protein [Acidobacteria bacterium]|nr:ThuA domain-containing protein [Acidobacteriota bacterium]
MFRLLCLTACLAGTAAAESPKIQALIFSGRNNHEWRLTTAHLRNLLSATGRFEVRVDEAPAGCTATTLAGFDLLVLDYNGPRWGPGCEQAVETFVRGGKGLVVIHAASYAFGGLEILGEGHVRTGQREPAWAEYARMVGGSWVEGPAKTGHGRRHLFQVRTVDQDHPIMQGLPAGSDQNDELYHRLAMRPEAHVLAVAFDATEIEGTGKDEPILWTVEYGRGRVFHTTLGHDVEAMSSPGFGATLGRGAEWAATGRVETPPPPERKISVLLVTGGHDYESSFYTLFQNQPDLRWDHGLDRASAEAFGRDMAGKYDVLVLYDLAQNITEEEKRNLMAFVASGGGIVALHHTLGSFQGWEGYQELIGGKYFLKAEGDHPASTFQHDVWINVQVADPEHPVTRGITPFRIYDEVYNKFWVSPKAKVLLTTHHPNSGRAIAWISPQEKARVVYIQLGHSGQAYSHPSFQQLLRQAIRWAARR